MSFEETIILLEGEIEKCHQKIGDYRQVIETLKKYFPEQNVPTRNPNPSLRLQPIAWRRKKGESAQKSDPAITGHGPEKPDSACPGKSGRGSKNPTSKYHGVSKASRPKADGTYMFRVQIAVNGRIKYLGQYAIEEMAAAVAQEALGNKQEAARLRAIAEQIEADMAELAENNPDRPLNKRKARKKLAGYRCKFCPDTVYAEKPKGPCQGCRQLAYEPVYEGEE